MANLFEVGLFDELEAIYPDTKAESGDKVYRVSGASGTYAGVHMVISGLQAGQMVSFEVKGPHQGYKLFELIPVPVEDNTGLITRTERFDGKYNPYVIRRAPFMIYEVLQPIRNLAVSKGQSVAVAFREAIQVEEDVENKWEIYVTVEGITQKLTFIVEAKKVKVMPSNKTTHKYVNWINMRNIGAFHKVVMWSKEWEDLVLSYFKLARYARQNIVWLPADLYFELNESQHPVLNEEKLSTLIRLADEAELYWLNGANLCGRKDGDWCATEAETILSKRIMPGEGEEDFRNMTTQLYKYIKEKGLENRWIQSFFDEPLDESANVYHRGATIINETMPGIRVLDANKATESLVGAMDIWCPTLDCYEKEFEFYRDRVEKGEEVWVYTCLEPTGPYLNRLLDMERIRPVLIEWANSLYPVKGFLHWGGNWFAVNPYKQSCVCMGQEDYTNFKLNYSAQLPAGDCGVMYPGDLMPLSTTRLEAHRIGFEDLYLIEQLKNKNKALVKEIVSTLVRSYKDYETDISLYRKTKKRLLEA